jgi:hypothetical protein
MSSGGSNYSTGMTGGGNQVRIDSPASQQNGYGSAPAPGGKGGFPSAQNPYQQQPSVYMPPSQPSFYQQAFTQPRMEAPPQQYGLGSFRRGNAYARPYRSPSSPIEARPPPDEMRLVPAVMPDRRYPVGAPPPSEMAYPTSEQPIYAVGPTPRMPYQEEPRYPVGATMPLPAELFEPPSQREYSRQAPEFNPFSAI